MGTKGIRICNLPRPRKIFPNREKQVQSRVVVLNNRIFILLFCSGWKLFLPLLPLYAHGRLTQLAAMPTPYFLSSAN